MPLGEIPFEDVQRLYREHTGEPIPLTRAEFAEVISARYMVFGRKGLGGPQPAETGRMLSEEAARIAADRTWLERETARLAQAAAALDRAFEALSTGH
jgi:argininosuccinate lyase